MACYFGLISYLDEQIGRILDAVDRLGLGESTRIVYSSDHGDDNGSRGLWGKGNLYRESTNVPLIVAGPDIPAGKVCATNANLVDLYPTFVDALALSPGDAPSGDSNLFDGPGAIGRHFDRRSTPDMPPNWRGRRPPRCRGAPAAGLRACPEHPIHAVWLKDEGIHIASGSCRRSNWVEEFVIAPTAGSRPPVVDS